MASNNATTGALGSLGSAALLYELLQAAPAASDERLKEDIEKVGQLQSGLNVYRFRYKGRPEMRIGVIAQEAEKTHPHAVFERNGFKHVIYAQLS